MKRRWFSAVLVAVVLLMLVSMVVSCSSEEDNGRGDLEAFRAALEADGFIVQEGVLARVDLVDLYNRGLIESCNANNAANPYLGYMLPTRPGQVLNQMATDAPINPAHKGMWFINRYRRDEALIYVGKTPPPCDYFSFCLYVHKRFFPEAGEYRKIFASTGDTQNLLTLRTSGEDVNPFSQDTLIVTTADGGIDARIRSAAESAGYPASIMNTIVIPTDVVRMGLDDRADTLVLAMRTAYFADSEAGKAFIESPDAVVWRITPSEPAQPDPYPTPALRVRGTGRTEMNLMPALNDLREAILARHGDLNATELTTSIWLQEGYVAMQEVVDVLGETRDTAYLRTNSFTLKDDPNEFVIVYGVNHAATGKATYSNFGVYGVTALNGVGGASSHDLAGTAEAYLPSHPQAKYLYVWKVARHADGNPRCFEVPYGIQAYGIDLDQEGFIGWRAYVEPQTKVGPIWHELIFDRAIKFSMP